ncbi:hypothetical protein V1525DRAFT_388953 [Lipomyces kononenkoae]|uniref:Uncharacterized protein n=1 Tax=Lipomyces kononenkoae TaxID=34357 RepID=A0ACC3T058_LIPKO
MPDASKLNLEASKWLQPDSNDIDPAARQVLQTHSGMRKEKVLLHVLVIRDKASLASCTSGTRRATSRLPPAWEAELVGAFPNIEGNDWYKLPTERGSIPKVLAGGAREDEYR